MTASGSAPRDCNKDVSQPEDRQDDDGSQNQDRSDAQQNRTDDFGVLFTLFVDRQEAAHRPSQAESDGVGSWRDKREGVCESAVLGLCQVPHRQHLNGEIEEQRDLAPDQEKARTPDVGANRFWPWRRGRRRGVMGVGCGRIHSVRQNLGLRLWRATVVGRRHQLRQRLAIAVPRAVAVPVPVPVAVAVAVAVWRSGHG